MLAVEIGCQALTSESGRGRGSRIDRGSEGTRLVEGLARQRCERKVGFEGREATQACARLVGISSCSCGKVMALFSRRSFWMCS